MSNSKQALTPSEGIYYILPTRQGHNEVLSQRADDTDEPAHMFFWEKVGVPRGRVQKEIDHIEYKPTGNYIILHGGDVPVSTIQYAVLQDFGLNELNRAGKVKWVMDDHEKMDPEDRKEFLETVKGG